MDTEKREMTDAEQKAEYQKNLKLLEEQEETLQFKEFTNEMALEIGLNILAQVKQENQAVAIDITRSGQQLFHYAMAGTTPDNGQWIMRKMRVVDSFQKNCDDIGTLLKNTGQTLEQKYHVSSAEFASSGGSFPIIIKNVGVVGTITVSGLPNDGDHALVVKVISEFLRRNS